MAATSSGLKLDPSDAGDAQIIARQVKVARQAGRDGLDRAKVTRARPDLEAAYDQGAAEKSSPATGGGRPGGGGPSTGRRAGDSFRTAGPGWKSVKPRSPARLPTRTADAGGFIAGLALYTVVTIYIRYGPEGWKDWLKAKFLNQVAEGATGAVGGKPKHKSGGSRAV